MKPYEWIKRRSLLSSFTRVALLILSFEKGPFAVPLGDVADFQWNVTTKMVEFSVGTPKVRIIFYKDDIFRIWVSS